MTSDRESHLHGLSYPAPPFTSPELKVKNGDAMSDIFFFFFEYIYLFYIWLVYRGTVDRQNTNEPRTHIL